MRHLVLPLCLLAPACGEPEPVSAEASVPPPPVYDSDIRFVDGTEAAGIRFVHDNGASEDFFYAEQLGVGAIFFDAEGDGDPDLYLLNGRRIQGQTEPAPRNAFYVNDGTGRFEDATERSGLGDPRYGIGVSGADFDNDGDTDLFVANFDGPNALYRNEGDGTFVDVAAAAGVEGPPGMVSSSAFADVDGDGWVDLYVGYCLEHSVENNKVCKWPLKDGSGALRRYCNPTNYRPLPDFLYRNRGDGTFEDVSEESGIRSGLGRTLGVAFADYDDDGDQDVIVACDRNQNLYLENDGTGRFSERALEAGIALSPDGKLQAGMGIAAGDLDGDQRLDLAITYFESEVNGFYRNLGGGTFEDVSRQNGTADAALPLLAWGIQLLDADLDRDLDVVIANGHFLPNVEVFRDPIAGYEQPNLCYENLGAGSFRSLGIGAGDGFAIERVSRGLAAADVDLDGDLDLLVANLHARPDLLINESERRGRHWLAVDLVGSVSNRDGIGSRVTLFLPEGPVVRELHTGQSYLSQSELRLHFGLGASAVVPRLEVRWPSGRVTRLEGVEGDRVLELHESDAPGTD